MVVMEVGKPLLYAGEIEEAVISPVARRSRSYEAVDEVLIFSLGAAVLDANGFLVPVFSS